MTWPEAFALVGSLWAIAWMVSRWIIEVEMRDPNEKPTAKKPPPQK